MARRPYALIFCILLTFIGGTAAAERHALLIGIGAYPKPILKLDGPANDIDALRQRLVEDWDFKTSNISTLVDADATKAAILHQLDRLAIVTGPEDYIFIYYSGHGTSAFDEDLQFEGAQLGKWTGALIPYDYTVGTTPGPEPAKWTDRLIIGRRDLKPRLTMLDRDRNVFVAFDTCFSGNSVRSISKRSVRWVNPVAPVRSRRGVSYLEDPFDNDAIFGAATAQEEKYPYRRLIYLSAARKYERAEDIPSWETIDNRPHGAMTNALLKGLDGAADADRNNLLTYDELYRFVHDEVSEKNQHMPQLLFPTTRPEVVQQLVFEHRRRSFTTAPTQSTVGTANAGAFQVKITPGLQHLRRPIEQLSQVEVVSGGRYNLNIERQSDGLVALYHASGDRIAGGFDARNPERLLDRIARLALVQELIDLTYPRQRFSLRLELSDRSGFLTPDQPFDITVRADRPAVLLLLNIDKTGTVSVLYPIDADELRRTSRLRETFEVIPPYGTEYLKLFAFSRTPEGLNRWLHRQIDPLNPDFDQLLRLLREPGAEAAEGRFKVVTVGELVSDGS